MNRMDHEKTTSLGCDLQEVVLPGESWRWKEPCPFSRPDCEVACLNCKHFITASTSEGYGPIYPYIPGDPVL